MGLFWDIFRQSVRVQGWGRGGILSDLHHVLPSVPVRDVYVVYDGHSIVFNSHSIRLSWSSSKLYNCVRWDRHIYIRRPGTFQAGAAGDAGAEPGAEGAAEFCGSRQQIRRTCFGKLCRSVRASLLHPGKNPTPPLGGSATLPGYLHRYSAESD